MNYQIDLEILCSECGKPLKTSNCIQVNRLMIIPCDNCISLQEDTREERENEVYINGRIDGINEGMKKLLDSTTKHMKSFYNENRQEE